MSLEPELRAQELMEEFVEYLNSESTLEEQMDDLLNLSFKRASAMATYDGKVISFLHTSKAGDLAKKVIKAKTEAK